MSRLARNIFYNLFGQLALLILGMVSAKYIFGHLGEDVLGIIYFAQMINTFAVAVLQLGITSTTIKEIAANESDPEYIVKIIRSGALFYWVAYVIVAVAIVALTPWFVRGWINVGSISPDAAIELLRILGVSTLLAVPLTFYVSVFRGVQKMGIPNVLDVATSMVQQAGIVAIITISGDVYWVVWWIAGNYLLKVIVMQVQVAQLFGWRSIVPRLDRGVVQRNRAFVIQLAAISLLATVHMQTDRFLIASLLPVGAVGAYGLLHATIARGSILTSSVAQSAFPALSELVAGGDRNRLLEQYRRLQDLLCYGLVPVYALIAFAMYPVLAAVLDHATSVTLTVPAVLLSIGFYMNGALTVPYFFSLATNRPEIVRRLNVLALFTTLPVTIVLTWQLGFVGAAASWVWYHVFAFAYAVPVICRECIGTSPREWFAHLVRVLGLAAVSYGVAGAVVAIAAPYSTPALLTGYLAASVVFALGTWRFMDRESRSAALGIVRKVLRR